MSWVWWDRLVIPAPRRWKLKAQKFKVILGYVVSRDQPRLLETLFKKEKKGLYCGCHV